MPGFDKAFFGVCIEMGFGILELLGDNVENASQRDVDVFRGEALEITLIVCDEILLPPFESQIGCSLLVMEGGKAFTTLLCQSRHVPMKSKKTALIFP